MRMLATVERVRPGSLLVRDRRTGHVVVVNTRTARCLFPGDLIRIFYNGVMTMSIPPQIFALGIQPVFPRRGCR